MNQITFPLDGVDPDHLTQLKYALSFAAEEIVDYNVSGDSKAIEVSLAPGSSSDNVRRKISELVERYRKREFGFPSSVEFEHQGDLVELDAWSGLLERKWVTPVGQGHVILRGPAAQVLGMVDAKVDRLAHEAFHAEREFYPNTIRCKTLDQVHHFTSFPEHIEFVGHIKGDLDVLNSFTDDCRQNGWSAATLNGRMGDQDFAISPSCCYHCYAGMENWELEMPGRCTTMEVNCHRYEGTNHRTMSRLRAFTMREVVWVGHPRFVIEGRAKAEELIIQWARDWELTGTFETANDMFFTEDYAVKASFQRQQQVKKELLLQIPQEKQTISVFSSNFHAMTFGKAFNITVGGRPASSGCIGWGYERWVYALFSQFGLNFALWPEPIREELAHYQESIGMKQ